MSRSPRYSPTQRIPALGSCQPHPPLQRWGPAVPACVASVRAPLAPGPRRSSAGLALLRSSRRVQGGSKAMAGSGGKQGPRARAALVVTCNRSRERPELGTGLQVPSRLSLGPPRARGPRTRPVWLNGEDAGMGDPGCIPGRLRPSGTRASRPFPPARPQAELSRETLPAKLAWRSRLLPALGLQQDGAGESQYTDPGASLALRPLPSAPAERSRPQQGPFPLWRQLQENQTSPLKSLS